MTVFTCLNTLKNIHVSALLDKIIVSPFYLGYAFEIIIGTVLRTRGKGASEMSSSSSWRRRSSSSGGGGGTSSSSKELVLSSTSSGTRWWY